MQSGSQKVDTADKIAWSIKGMHFHFRITIENSKKLRFFFENLHFVWTKLLKCLFWPEEEIKSKFLNLFYKNIRKTFFHKRTEWKNIVYIPWFENKITIFWNSDQLDEYRHLNLKLIWYFQIFEIRHMEGIVDLLEQNINWELLSSSGRF